MKILGVTRHNEFSPNHIGNDTAILQAVAARLAAAGCEVSVCDETAFAAMPDEDVPGVIFHMARRPDTLARLACLEAAGCIVLNRARGVQNCSRETMTRILIDNAIPHPESRCLSTARGCFTTDDELAALLPGWLKRGDFHAVHREDVSYVRTATEADELLAEYALRGITRAVLNEHLHGDLVKFYGVEGTGFFHWFYPMEVQHSKFGCEAQNDALCCIPFAADALKLVCDRAARALEIRIYGGDCIVAADGSFRIIDFNDWPSFAPCRDTAAPYIARAILAAAGMGLAQQEKCTLAVNE